MAIHTLTTDVSQETRLQAAVGRSLNLGRAATGTEVDQFTRALWRQVVQQQERITAQNLIVDVTFDPT